jgi:5-methyltetrahydrofolate--homocysteine methyltransferase
MDLRALQQAVVTGDAPGLEAQVKQALVVGIAAAAVLNEALVPAMQEVGTRFECGEFYLPDMLVASRAMQRALQILRPHLVAQNVQPVGKAALGTVPGDLHDIGKKLVGMMLEGAGFEVEDLGVDVAPERFVEAAKNGAHIIGMSALLTTTMPAMQEVMAALERAGVRQQVKVMVGGAPVTQAYADAIGADGYAADAASAVRRATALIAAS